MTTNKEDSWIETYSGKKVNVFNIDPDTIDITDIAHALALCNRFNGHTKRPISVAEHSVWASIYVSEENALQALMHDTAEAYISDVPRPIKQYLPKINRIDDELTAAIFNKFGIPFPLCEEVVSMDRMLCKAEAKHSGMNVDNWRDDSPEFDHHPQYFPWPEAKRHFLARFHLLTTGEELY